ncbi:MAG: bifunctional adenosylcobinamide kinase/adenosylcobinamide-phosphate guanylyltransferase [Candidatus Omnitrophota bacterium]
MGTIIFILGGARSGKSTYAVSTAKKLNKDVAFVATCQPLDNEMKQRIEKHKKSRPLSWKTYEEPRELPQLIEKIAKKHKVIIIDCLTIFISNLLLSSKSEKRIYGSINKVLDMAGSCKSTLIIVSNEVGLGIVPENKMARRFRDIAGNVNKIVAKRADQVFLMTAGIPVNIKKGKKDDQN